MAPIYGLFASLVPLVVCPLPGTSRHLAVGAAGIQLIGDIPAGLPDITVRSLDPGSIGEPRSAAIPLSLVQFMSVISLGRVFANRHRYVIDPNRELIDDSGAGFRGGADHFHTDPYHAVLHVLERWDAEEGSERADAYREKVEEEREDVNPTSEAPYL